VVFFRTKGKVIAVLLMPNSETTPETIKKSTEIHPPAAASGEYEDRYLSRTFWMMITILIRMNTQTTRERVQNTPETRSPLLLRVDRKMDM
jgi:hypothetical protein